MIGYVSTWVTEDQYKDYLVGKIVICQTHNDEPPGWLINLFVPVNEVLTVSCDDNGSTILNVRKDG